MPLEGKLAELTKLITEAHPVDMSERPIRMQPLLDWLRKQFDDAGMDYFACDSKCYDYWRTTFYISDHLRRWHCANVGVDCPIDDGVELGHLRLWKKTGGSNIVEVQVPIDMNEWGIVYVDKAFSILQKIADLTKGCE